MSKDIIFRSDLPVRYVMHMGDDLAIARAAWGDWDREFDSADHAGKFFDKIVGEHHGSPVEFSSIVFQAEMPLFTATQLLRHRTMSFAGFSGRYNEFIPAFYLPPRERPTKRVSKSKMNPRFGYLDAPDWNLADNNRRAGAWECWKRYRFSRDTLGEAEEVARMHLPEHTYTSYSFCANLRNIFGFLSLRIDHPDNAVPTHPQWEIEQIAISMENHIARLWPLTYAAFTKFGRTKP